MRESLGRATSSSRAKPKTVEDRCTYRPVFTGRVKARRVGLTSARPAVTLQAPGRFIIYPGNGNPAECVVKLVEQQRFP